MAQTATQRTTGVTRLKGPTVITARGAGSAGHDQLTKGAGLDVGLSVQIPSAQTANALQVEKPDGTVIAGFDAAGGLIVGALKVSQRAVRVALTAAQLITLNTVPVALVAAPAAGLALICTGFIFQMVYGTVQFTGGGVVAPVYHGATTALTAGTVAAATVQAAANYTGYAPGAAGATAQAITSATGIDLYAATGNFAAGDSTAVVTLFYDVVTLG